MPTKIGEFLASGRPVVVNKDLGDMGHIVRQFDCGVVVADNSDTELERTVVELDRLLDETSLAERCRDAAVAHFNLEHAVDDLFEIYQSMLRSHVDA
jgi:glycosyltransferase involved in cell wall biosynthesis